MSETIISDDYEPLPSGIKVHESTAVFKVLVGGYGSGKSRCAVEEVKALAIEHPGIEIFVMRKTFPSLRDSTLQEFKRYFHEEIGKYNEKLEQMNIFNGSLVKFRSLDEPSKMKSTNPAVIVWDEADEFTKEEFDIIKARIRQRRPVSDDREQFPLHFILVLNPVDEDHWIYKEFVLNKHTYEMAGGCLVVHFSTRDNEKNLPPNYIAQTTAGMSAEEIERYIDGKWGTIVKGPSIYGDIFNADIHLAVWTRTDDMILLRGWDFGFNHPAVVCRLKDKYGRKNIDFEMMGEKEYLEPFARRAIMQMENRYGKHIRIIDYCDPRGFDKSDKGQTSVEILNGVGVYPTGERGVRAYVDPGIKSVRKELSTLILGQPELTINPSCTIVRSAYGGRYIRDDDGQPKKDGYYEHICDADRYISYNDKSAAAVDEAIQAHRQRRELRQQNKITGY